MHWSITWLKLPKPKIDDHVINFSLAPEKLVFFREEWGKMSMVGQSESDDVFAFGVKAKELMIQGHQFCFSFSNRKKMLIFSPWVP